ncbi:unnamed protein product [Caenorhabditis auriculariae]|uniref:CUB-like domain-containing protein n=1 Tax=Caenorhabditis auriculariae TaxID=2777116 RepID=A0A8S1H9J5_9PELO|nr:unnamed protein product [Caenorhabditis auriculariae]
MTALLRIFSLTILIGAVSSDYTCDTKSTVNGGLDTIYSVPTGWNGTENPALLPPNLNCSWTFNVPAGQFAVLYLKSTTISDFFVLTDSAGNAERIHIDMQGTNYFYTQPYFKVDLATTAFTNGSLSFVVHWVEIPNNYTTSRKMVVRNAQGFLISADDTISPLIVTADTQVSVLATPLMGTLDFLPFLRATMIYDGDSINATFIGSLYTGISQKRQLVSTGKKLTIFTLAGMSAHQQILIQDYDNTRDIVEYQVPLCITPICATTFDASKGPAAITTVLGSSDAEYLTNVDMNENSNLTIFAGLKMVDPWNKLATYRRQDLTNRLPQEIRGYLRTYYFSSGAGSIGFTRNTATAKWGTPRIGRSGFVMSNNYPFSDKNQAGTDVFSSYDGNLKTPYSFFYSLSTDNLRATNSFITISGNGDKNSYVARIDSKSPQNATGSFVSSEITIKMMNDGISTGFFVQFSFDSAGFISSYIPSISLVLLFKAIFEFF